MEGGRVCPGKQTEESSWIAWETEGDSKGRVVPYHGRLAMAANLVVVHLDRICVDPAERITRKMPPILRSDESIGNTITFPVISSPM